jgi:hypothetical protein
MQNSLTSVKKKINSIGSSKVFGTLENKSSYVDGNNHATLATSLEQHPASGSIN